MLPKCGHTKHDLRIALTFKRRVKMVAHGVTSKAKKISKSSTIRLSLKVHQEERIESLYGDLIMILKFFLKEFFTYVVAKCLRNMLATTIQSPNKTQWTLKAEKVPKTCIFAR